MLKGDKMTQAKFELEEYSVRVLDMVKGKFGLKNRNDALNRFILEYGQDFLEPITNESYLKELDKKVLEHEKKYSKRRMSLKELDELLN